MTAAYAPATLTDLDEIAARTNEELLVATAAGSQASFDELYRRILPAVRGVSRRVLRDPDIAAETAQEVMVEVWSKAERFDPEKGSAAGWITTLAHRRAVDRVRSVQASRDRDEKVSLRDRERSFDVVADEVETNLDHWQVRQALSTLTERQREAIELAYFGGHSYREVAVLLETPEGTVKSRIRSGLKRMRQDLVDVGMGTP